MKRRFLFIFNVIPALLLLSSCHSKPSSDGAAVSADPATIATGEIAFNKNCSGCHNFRQDGIGPQLGGLTGDDRIRNFIINPKKVIESGDDRAVKLFKQYKVIMPSFASLKTEEMNGLIAFLHTHTSPVVKNGNGKELSNPIPEAIKYSGLQVNIRLLTQFPVTSDSSKMPLTRITQLGFRPNKHDLFILDLRGKLYNMQHDKPVVYMDMAKLEPSFIHEPGLATGFGSFAFHPGFEKNGLIYTTHTEPPRTGKADFSFPDSIKVILQWVLTEWKCTDPGAPVFSGTGRELMRVNMVSGIHGMQEIAFNPLSKPRDKDYGMLYIGVGDGGAVENGYPSLAHSPEKVWGTILRIDPAGRNSANHKYGIPGDNPFVQSGNASKLKEIYAYGFRNPHRITWLRSGKMLGCNIGQSSIESVNLILPGHDYGWPIREGTFALDNYEHMSKVSPLPANDSIYHITYPVAEYDHDEGNAISGGYEYWGTTVPQLKGKYLFGDIPSGRLFYIDVADVRDGKLAQIKEWKITLNGVQTTLKQLCGSDRIDLHFGRGANGEMYILTKADGKMYKLTVAGVTH